MITDIFALLDDETASKLRPQLNQKDAINLALSYRPRMGRSHSPHFGNKRQYQLYRKLNLIEKAPGQEDEYIADCEFIFTERGAEIARLILKAHKARNEQASKLRNQISVMRGQLKRAGLQDESDAILVRNGVKSKRLGDIKLSNVQEIHSALTELLKCP